MTLYREWDAYKFDKDGYHVHLFDGLDTPTNPCVICGARQMWVVPVEPDGEAACWERYPHFGDFPKDEQDIIREGIRRTVNAALGVGEATP